MQFILLGYDGKDDGAPGRRLAVREQHLALGDQLVAEGTLLFATAILDADEQMIGSMLVLEFPSRAELDTWLATEPYVTGDVWREIEIRPAKVSPSFARSAQR
ncbi:MAG: YciI family protein [Pseudonocardiaceae bacterium]